MARIAGIDLPKNKRGIIGLTYIFGVGKTTANAVLVKAGIDVNKKVSDWSDDEIATIRGAIQEFKVEGQLRSEVQMNIKRLMDIGCYRGIRHSRHLPVRGQQTKTNNRTIRGNARHTMGSGKRKVEKK